MYRIEYNLMIEYSYTKSLTFRGKKRRKNMKFKKLLVGVLGVAMSVTLLAGCGGDKGKTGSASKDIVINLQTEPKTLNSIKATGSIDGNVLRQCMEGLVVLDENDKPEPGVAKDWKVSDDKLTVTFNLRDNAVWSNGEKVTAP